MEEVEKTLHDTITAVFASRAGAIEANVEEQKTQVANLQHKKEELAKEAESLETAVGEAHSRVTPPQHFPTQLDFIYCYKLHIILHPSS